MNPKVVQIRVTGSMTHPLTWEQVLNMKALWPKVPGVKCKGLCANACTNVPITVVETLYLIERHKAEVVLARHQHLPEQEDTAEDGFFTFPTLGLNEPCQFLKEGRCSIYEERPLVCRAYGHPVLNLECPHGCEHDPLTEGELASLMLSMIAVRDRGTPVEDKLEELTPLEVFERHRDQVDDLSVQVLVTVEEGSDPEEIRRVLSRKEGEEI